MTNDTICVIIAGIIVVAILLIKVNKNIRINKILTNECPQCNSKNSLLLSSVSVASSPLWATTTPWFCTSCHTQGTITLKWSDPRSELISNIPDEHTQSEYEMADVSKPNKGSCKYVVWFKKVARSSYDDPSLTNAVTGFGMCTRC